MFEKVKLYKSLNLLQMWNFGIVYQYFKSEWFKLR